jgi:hypothetical protein
MQHPAVPALAFGGRRKGFLFTHLFTHQPQLPGRSRTEQHQLDGGRTVNAQVKHIMAGQRPYPLWPPPSDF